MAKKEETPESAEKPEGDTPAEQDVSAEKPESDTPAEQNVGAEKPLSTNRDESVQQSQVNEEISKDARMWSMICHLAGLAGFIMPAAGNIVAPLIIWQIKKDDYPFVDEQGKEAVNFQISISIYFIVSLFLCCICIGAFLVAAVIIVFFVFLLIAAVKANNGYHYRYPLSIRFIK
jgi:uncharacterized Tic20 family protein